MKPVSARPSHRNWIKSARHQVDAAQARSGSTQTGVWAHGRRTGSAGLPTDFFPGYEIVREIYTGGQGVVFAAIQKSTGRTVALKALRDSAFGGPMERARFEREVQILAALRHPNIVSIHDSGTAAGVLYLVMDFIAGVPLDRYVQTGEQPKSSNLSRSNCRRAEIKEWLRLFTKVCDAVNAAHLRGVIHRDLKPGNVLVDEAGEPYVLDFGLARFADGEVDNEAVTMTALGQFVGSLPWSSPEQASGEAIDLRSDVYSLGVMLYQCLTGRFPYVVTGRPRDVIDRVRSQAPAKPRSLCPTLDDEVETIVLKCLNKEPERRYQSAGELARDIRHYLAEEPIEAKRDSGWYVLKKTLRRYRLPVAAAAFVVIMLAVFGMAMAAARARAEREADKSRQVLAFLQNMLAGVDPEDIGKDALTVREVLDHTAGRLERELVDQPDVAASVHHTLGNHYRTLGLYSDADRHLRKAVELRRALTADDDTELAEALSDFAANLQEKGDFSDVEAPTREALGMRRRLFGQDSLEVAESLHDLASILIKEGRAREAEPACRESLDIRRRRLGAEHAEVATSAGTLGLCLITLDRLDEAEAAMREAVEMVRLLPGDNERALAARLTFLSDVLRTRGKYADEEAVVREAIDIRSRRLAQDHPALGWNQYCLARIRRRMGDLDEAEFACRRALDIFTTKRDPQHIDIADCQQLMAQIYDDRGNLAEAERWWIACLEIRRRLFPPEHFDIEFAQSALAKNKAAQSGRWSSPDEPAGP